MWHSEEDRLQDTVTCPFCGLLCDDLRLQTVDDGRPHPPSDCQLAQSSYREAFALYQASAEVAGEATTLEQALDACSKLLQQADAPLFAGLATDVNGMRALLELAESCAAHIDHGNADALFRNLRVLQDSGWFTTTFAEVRNRADLLVVLGKECVDLFPRLFERVLLPGEALFSPPAARRLVLVGPWREDELPARLASLQPTVIPIEMRQLGHLSGLLRALLAGRPLPADALGANIETRLPALLADLRSAEYSVFCWSAAELAFPHAELSVDALVGLVRDLNLEGRAAALPLTGTLGDQTANQVCTWQTGYSLRSSLQRGYPQHDPVLYRHQDLLARGEVDLLLWVSALSPEFRPPANALPSIVLGHPGMSFEKPPDVFIPVGIPGIDHPGHLYRSDASCALPLGKLRDRGLPSVASVLRALYRRLPGTLTS